jgi:hypothetical protein
MSSQQEPSGSTQEADETERTTENGWVEFEYQPPTIATAVVLVAAVVSIAALAPVAFYSSVGAGLGAAVMVAGLLRGTHNLVTAGAGVMFAALVAGALSDPPAVLVVVVGLCTLVAFDAGRYGVQLSRQIGQEETTRTSELYHIGLTASVSVVSAAVGTVLFLVAPEQQPALVLMALLLAGVLFISGLVLLNETDELA